MKKRLSSLFLAAFCALLLAGCVSGERMVRNSPFAGSKFYRDGVNLFPLYYQEGVNRSILFPLIDIDNRGFAVRPFYHKDNDEHGVLWPLCAFNSKEGWLGTFFWEREKYSGLLPLFVKGRDFLWVFPASWWSNNQHYAVLPFFYRDERKNVLWAVNVYKDNETFLVLPFYGKGKKWVYLLNFVHYNDQEREKDSYFVLPLAFFTADKEGKELLTPLFSFRTGFDELQMLNVAMVLYHYSEGNHHVFYPFFDVNAGKHHREFWLWPLGYYGFNKRADAPFFLFSYSNFDSSWQGSGFTTAFDEKRIQILSPLVFDYTLHKETQKSTTEVLPFGALWYAECGKDSFDHRVLGGALFRNAKNKHSRRFSLLYKLFSYHRFKGDVKWEFFPFIKIMETSKGSSWSFCWRLLEKHDGGGHIFFIPWGKSEEGK